MSVNLLSRMPSASAPTILSADVADGLVCRDVLTADHGGGPGPGLALHEQSIANRGSDARAESPLSVLREHGRDAHVRKAERGLPDRPAAVALPLEDGLVDLVDEALVAVQETGAVQDAERATAPVAYSRGGLQHEAAGLRGRSAAGPEHPGDGDAAPLSKLGVLLAKLVGRGDRGRGDIVAPVEGHLHERVKGERIARARTGARAHEHPAGGVEQVEHVEPAPDARLLELRGDPVDPAARERLADLRVEGGETHMVTDLGEPLSVDEASRVDVELQVVLGLVREAPADQARADERRDEADEDDREQEPDEEPGAQGECHLPVRTVARERRAAS